MFYEFDTGIADEINGSKISILVFIWWKVCAHERNMWIMILKTAMTRHKHLDFETESV